MPDSYTPFTVTALAAAIVVPAALGLPSHAGAPGRRPSRWVGLGLGLLLGLCYLSRQEAVWLGLVVLATMVMASASADWGTRLREIGTRLWPIVAGGLIVVVPWLVRNTLELGSPFPGQTVENLFLVRNEDIFAYGERPTASAYLSQDLGTLLGNPIAAAGSALSDALLFPAFPIGVVGLVSIVGLWRSPSLRHPTALTILLLSGGLTFLATVLLFPVASRWGTYLHASGPFLVGLTATAVLGSDALAATHLSLAWLAQDQRRHRAGGTRAGDAGHGRPAAGFPGRSGPDASDSLRGHRSVPGRDRTAIRPARPRHARDRPPDVAGNGHWKACHRPA